MCSLSYGVRTAAGVAVQVQGNAVYCAMHLIEWVRRKKGIVHTVLSCVLKSRLMARADFFSPSTADCEQRYTPSLGIAGQSGGRKEKKRQIEPQTCSSIKALAQI